MSCLKFLLCGYEKSGTTLLNEILRRHPDLDSGHEVGVFLGNSPQDFPSHQPYFAFFRKSWRLSREQALGVCDTPSWSVFFEGLRASSPLIVKKDVGVFDKTPIYMLHLLEVLTKAQGLPCVVNVRDPRAIMLSWANWSGHREDPQAYVSQNLDQLVQRYCSYGDGYRRAAKVYGDRILLNRFEDFCQNPEARAKEIFEFLGYTFSGEFLNFDSEFFVYGNTVSRSYIKPYQDKLSAALCAQILEATNEFSEWHFHGS
ncbi:sulfotransferase family protein [Halioglobus pacificus]|uniref:Sulfotransferase n=1 Tax=Parahalioglobus pacificus TaxID=930806 RepID=A0A918XH06_9GAMM|nr:sulfotransferase [Halioglobus pacificus]GHD31948.1 hypothetical protein GCM10007053_15540 [Halioglobus pacificus]